jgi:hypothetical protein
MCQVYTHAPYLRIRYLALRKHILVYVFYISHNIRKVKIEYTVKLCAPKAFEFRLKHLFYMS